MQLYSRALCGPTQPWLFQRSSLPCPALSGTGPTLLTMGNMGQSPPGEPELPRQWQPHRALLRTRHMQRRALAKEAITALSRLARHPHLGHAGGTGKRPWDLHKTEEKTSHSPVLAVSREAGFSPCSNRRSHLVAARGAASQPRGAWRPGAAAALNSAAGSHSVPQARGEATAGGFQVSPAATRLPRALPHSL